MFFKLMRFIVGTAMRFYYHIEFRGYESTPKKGGYIVICNHITAADPIIMTIKFKPQIFFMGKQELFKNPISGFFFKAVGAFPVERGKKADFGALDKATQIIKEEKCLGIFPEGKRSKTGKLLRGKSGAALIAARTGADIIPVGITFVEKGKFRSKIIVEYGGIIKHEELSISKEPTPRELKGATQLMMQKIEELYHPEMIKSLGEK